MISLVKIKTVCVCGAGTMGSGIAQIAAQSGFNVIQFDINQDMLAKSKAFINKGLQHFVDKGKLTVDEKLVLLERIFFTTNTEDCIADIIIEAIIENKEAKVNLFNRLAANNNETTIFATNTSSISVSAIANETKNTGNVIGMHFFNPAPVMKLVEIIRTAQTSETVVQQVFQLATVFGKTTVICQDSPGFIVNRVARPYYLEAMKLLENSLSTVEIVDTVMEATGFKMGPFKLMDLIGMDVNFSVSNIVWEALGKPERLKPSSIQEEKVKARELGRKTGKGFYNY